MGQRVSFWNDKCVGNDLLSRLYPDLYSLSLFQTQRATTQHATVAEMRTGQAWNLQFRRLSNDQDMETIAYFYASLADFTGLVEEVGRLEQQKDKSGKSTVNSAFKYLNSSEFQEKNWPWKMTWKTKIPYKVVTIQTRREWHSH